jgi:predicted DNA-binding transcriptional regulator AlpA
MTGGCAPWMSHRRRKRAKPHFAPKRRVDCLFDRLRAHLYRQCSVLKAPGSKVVGVRGEISSSEAATPQLLDVEQVAVKLEIKRSEAAATAKREGFPRPAGYHRGRFVWDEAAIASWQQLALEQPLGEVG